MGKLIDAVSLCTLAFLAAFFVFRRFLNGWLLPLLFATVLVICARRITAVPRRYFTTRKTNRKRATRLVDSWPFRSPEQSEKEARQIISATLGPDLLKSTVIFLPRHASRPLTAEDMLSHYRTARTDLVIICACPAQSAALSAADTCASPTVRILDRNAMIRLAQRTDLCAPHRPALRLSCRIRSALEHLRPSRCLFPACTMLLVYVLTGKISYLIASAGLLLLWVIRTHLFSQRNFI